MTEWPPPGSGTPLGPVRLWTLVKDGRAAICEAHAHPLGVELVVSVNDDIRRTEAFRVVRDAEGVATEWRAQFEAKGWTA
jgi:hypothetical protein